MYLLHNAQFHLVHLNHCYMMGGGLLERQVLAYIFSQLIAILISHKLQL